jgi:multiple sugar transport system substrate-binding protein
LAHPLGRTTVAKCRILRKHLEKEGVMKVFKAATIVALSLMVSVMVLFIGPSSVMADKTEIRYMTFIDPNKEGPRQEALRQRIAIFEKRYPEYKIVVDVVPWAEIDKTLISAVASGKAPDVIRISSLVLGQHIPAGTIMPLDRFVKDWSPEQKKGFIAPWDFTVYDGHKMSMFLENRTVVLYYRQDYLEKAGFEGPPQTLDELVNRAAGIQKALPNVAGMAIGLSAKRRAATLMEAIPPLVWSAGGEIVDDSGKAAYTGPSAVKAFNFIRDMVTKYEVMPKSVISYTYDDMHSGLQSGTIGMGTLGTHRYIAIRSGMKAEEQKYLKTAPVPGFGKTAPALIFGWTLAISSICEKPEAAWKWIDFMTSPEAQLINAKVGGEMPSRMATFDDPWFQTDEASHMLIWRDYINEYGKVFKYPTDYTQMAEGWAQAIQKMILQNAEAKEVLQEAAERYNSSIMK